MEDQKQKKITYVKGDLIQKALNKEFDVIAHGCNCFCTQYSGIAYQMTKFFCTDNEMYFHKEHPYERGDYNKMGTIDWCTFYIDPDRTDDIKIVSGMWNKNRYWPNAQHAYEELGNKKFDEAKELVVVNAYTQYRPGKNSPTSDIPLDYEALRSCMRKLNFHFKKMHIGLPKIGCGLAKGDWKKVEKIIGEELTDCTVTVVEYEEPKKEEEKKDEKSTAG